MEGPRDTTGRVGRVDFHGPRQRRGAPEELLVEVVAPAADGLGEREAGRDGVGQRGVRDAVSAGGGVGGQRTPRAAAPHPPPPPPDLGGGDRAPAPRAPLEVPGGGGGGEAGAGPT